MTNDDSLTRQRGSERHTDADTSFPADPDRNSLLIQQARSGFVTKVLGQPGEDVWNEL